MGPGNDLGTPAPDEPVEGADELPEARDGDASEGQDGYDEATTDGEGDTSAEPVEEGGEG